MNIRTYIWFAIIITSCALQAGEPPVPKAHLSFYEFKAKLYNNSPLLQKSLKELLNDSATLQRAINGLPGQTVVTPGEPPLKDQCSKALSITKKRIKIKQLIEALQKELTCYSKPNPGNVLSNVIKLSSKSLVNADTEDIKAITSIASKPCFINNYIASKAADDIINIQNKKNKHASIAEQVDYKKQLQPFAFACKLIQRKLSATKTTLITPFPIPQWDVDNLPKTLDELLQLKNEVLDQIQNYPSPSISPDDLTEQRNEIIKKLKTLDPAFQQELIPFTYEERLIIRDFLHPKAPEPTIPLPAASKNKEPLLEPTTSQEPAPLPKKPEPKKKEEGYHQNLLSFSKKESERTQQPKPMLTDQFRWREIPVQRAHIPLPAKIDIDIESLSCKELCNLSYKELCDPSRYQNFPCNDSLALISALIAKLTKLGTEFSKDEKNKVFVYTINNHIDALKSYYDDGIKGNIKPEDQRGLGILLWEIEQYSVLWPDRIQPAEEAPSQPIVQHPPQPPAAQLEQEKPDAHALQQSAIEKPVKVVNTPEYQRQYEKFNKPGAPEPTVTTTTNPAKKSEASPVGLGEQLWQGTISVLTVIMFPFTGAVSAITSLMSSLINSLFGWE